MTQKERSTELLLADVDCDNAPCELCKYEDSEDACIKHLSGVLADFLLENGVIVLPCKVGDTIWFENCGEIESAVIFDCEWKLTSRGVVLTGVYAKNGAWMGVYFNGSRIGQNVFFTREEAEKALAERMKNDG